MRESKDLTEECLQSLLLNPLFVQLFLVLNDNQKDKEEYVT